MDEDNFDLARVSLCGDLLPDGSLLPMCAHNVSGCGSKTGL